MYAVILEGEPLGCVWGLESTKHYTLAYKHIYKAFPKDAIATENQYLGSDDRLHARIL